MSAMVAITIAAAIGWTGSDPVASGSSYRVKPSDIVLPAGTPLGQYRRTTHPFPNWTLVCDENLSTRQRVCNISQIIEDAHGQMAFSWTLAGTEAGQPMMIVRLPAPIMGNRVSVRVGDTFEQSVTVDCNESLCAGLLEMNRALEDAITARSIAEATYTTARGQIIRVHLPLDGLSQAAAALR